MNFIRKLPIPQEIKAQFPLKPEWEAVRDAKLAELRDIFAGKNRIVADTFDRHVWRR